MSRILFPPNVTPRIVQVLLKGCVMGFVFTLDLLSAPVSGGRGIAGPVGDGARGIGLKRLVYACAREEGGGSNEESVV